MVMARSMTCSTEMHDWMNYLIVHDFSLYAYGPFLYSKKPKEVTRTNHLSWAIKSETSLVLFLRIFKILAGLRSASKTTSSGLPQKEDSSPNLRKCRKVETEWKRRWGCLFHVDKAQLVGLRPLWSWWFQVPFLTAGGQQWGASFYGVWVGFFSFDIRLFEIVLSGETGWVIHHVYYLQ